MKSLKSLKSLKRGKPSVLALCRFRPFYVDPNVRTAVRGLVADESRVGYSQRSADQLCCLPSLFTSCWTFFMTTSPRRDQSSRRTPIWIASCVVAWSFVPWLATNAGTLHPHQYLFWSSLVSAIGLHGVTLITGRWSSLRAFSTTDLRRQIALASLGPFGYYALLYSAYGKAWQFRSPRRQIVGSNPTALTRLRWGPCWYGQAPVKRTDTGSIPVTAAH